MKAFAIIFQICPLRTVTVYDIKKMCYGEIVYPTLEFICEKKPRQKKEERYLSIQDERELFDEFDQGMKNVYFYGFPITKDQLLDRYPGVSLELAKRQYYEEIMLYIYLGNYDPIRTGRYYRAVDGVSMNFFNVDFQAPFHVKTFSQVEEDTMCKRKIKKR